MIIKIDECFLCENIIEDSSDRTCISIVGIYTSPQVHCGCWKEAGGENRLKFTRESWNNFAGKDYEIPENYCVIFLSGIATWYKNSNYHRDDDKPAIIYPDGTKEWWKDGKLHRDGDKPAMIYPDGTKHWYKNGKRHREGGPATIHHNGHVEWWQHGVHLPGKPPDKKPIKNDFFYRKYF